MAIRTCERRDCDMTSADGHIYGIDGYTFCPDDAAEYRSHVQYREYLADRGAFEFDDAPVIGRLPWPLKP